MKFLNSICIKNNSSEISDKLNCPCFAKKETQLNSALSFWLVARLNNMTVEHPYILHV